MLNPSREVASTNFTEFGFTWNQNRVSFSVVNTFAIVGCHTPEDAERRRKRQIDINQLVVEVDRTVFLRDFFVECMREMVSTITVYVAAAQ